MTAMQKAGYTKAQELAYLWKLASALANAKLTAMLADAYQKELYSGR